MICYSFKYFKNTVRYSSSNKIVFNFEWISLIDVMPFRYSHSNEKLLILRKIVDFFCLHKWPKYIFWNDRQYLPTDRVQCETINLIKFQPSHGSLDFIRNKARFKRRSILAPNLTDELSTAEERRLNQFGLERQTTLNSAGSAALCNVGAAPDSYGALVMSRT